MIEEARLVEKASGLAPATDGWFVVNVRATAWITNEAFGSACVFESPDARFSDLGVNLRVLRRGQPNALYHAESAQEDFLVLAGECLLLVEGEERRLHAWDFVHCPPNVAHVFIGTGESPCVILMAGAREPDKALLYPVAELARRHGVSVGTETTSPAEAYAQYPEIELRRPDGWDALPWA